MQSIKIDTGAVTIPIERDGELVSSINFNPNEVTFVEKFYGLISRLEEKEKEYKHRLEELGDDEDVDSYGIPKNMGEGLKLLHDICDYMKTEIDSVFGVGTSEAVFGNATTLDMFEQFLDGVTPYIQQVRIGKTEKYTGNRAQKRATAKVMK